MWHTIAGLKIILMKNNNVHYLRHKMKKKNQNLTEVKKNMMTENFVSYGTA